MKKVLTIKEPYASLVINGIKKYEFRTWKTNYRGTIYIHAGLGVNKTDIERFKCYNINYHNGYILGSVDIIDCILITNSNIDSIKKENALVYSNIKVGEYAWKLDNIKIINNNTPIKGKLGLWNIDDM